MHLVDKYTYSHEVFLIRYLVFLISEYFIMKYLFPIFQEIYWKCIINQWQWTEWYMHRIKSYWCDEWYKISYSSMWTKICYCMFKFFQCLRFGTVLLRGKLVYMSHWELMIVLLFEGIKWPWALNKQETHWLFQSSKETVST